MTVSALKSRIILADDHVQMLEQVSKVLEHEFEIVAAVHDGALAVEYVADLKPDAVLLDIHMPGMGGDGSGPTYQTLGIIGKDYLSHHRHGPRTGSACNRNGR